DQEGRALRQMALVIARHGSEILRRNDQNRELCLRQYGSKLAADKKRFGQGVAGQEECAPLAGGNTSDLWFANPEATVAAGTQGGKCQRCAPRPTADESQLLEWLCPDGAAIWARGHRLLP